MKTYESTQAEVAAVQEELDKRKRRMILGLVLGLIALSAFLFSGTLAKYVTEGTGSDTGRVAKWGVTVNTNSGQAFKTQYETDEISGYSGTYTVQSVNTDKVLAPGTKGTVGGFSLSGAPEVATRVTVSVVDPSSALSGWTAEDTSAYEPVVWTLKKNGTPESGVDKVSFATLATALNAIKADYAPNAGFAAADTYTIEWEWPFNGNDAADTFLGEKTTAPTITLAYKVTATQID